MQGYISARNVAEAWHAQHSPQPQPPAPVIELWCRTSDQLDEDMRELKAEGYRLKRGSKTETSCTVIWPKSI